MTAQELRIGNYLKTAVLDYVAVAEIWHKTISVSILSDSENLTQYTLDLSNIEPIPLTEEWLLKFGYTETGFMGFEKGFGNNSILHIQFMAGGVITGFIEGDSTYVLIGKIDFVHQLQNLCYTLTGKELTI